MVRTPTLAAVVLLVLLTPPPRGVAWAQAPAPGDDPDRDGFSTIFELFFGTDPYDPDTDDDGFDDGFELRGLLNWRIGSPLEADSDHDGIDDPHDDYDGDGVSNLAEDGGGTNMFLADSDHDGLDDGKEFPLGFDPLRHDSDADGVRDSDEDADGDDLVIGRELALGTDPGAADTDGDGVLDGAEVALCTQPRLADAGTDTLCLRRTPDATPDWKLFQRDVAGAATIPVRLHYRLAAPARLEVAVVDSATITPLPGHDYADHGLALTPAAGPGGAVAALDVTRIPQGGTYDLLVRAVDPVTGAVLAQDAARSLAVGDVFLAAGQSNMSGENGLWEDPRTFEAPDPAVHLFGNDGRWKLAREPMDDPADSVDGVSADRAPRSSPMLRFAKEVARGTGVPVAVIPAAKSGSAIAPAPTGWERDASHPLSRATLYGSAVSRVLVQAYGAPIAGLLWYQGESNNGQDADTYRAALAWLIANLRQDLGNPDLFVASCQLAALAGATPREEDAWMEIREGQRRYALADPRSILIGTIDLPTFGAHLLGPGYREVGRRLGVATLRALYRVPASTGPAVRRIRRVRLGTRIRIGYDRAVTGGGDPSLFRVVEHGVEAPITLATVRGRSVTLALAQPVSDAARVTYGLGGAGKPWVVGERGEGAALLFLNAGLE